MTKRTTESRLARTLLSALIFGTGLGLSLCKGLDCYEYWNSRDWHHTRGVVVRSQYKRVPSRTFFFFGPRARTGQSTPRRVIGYHYNVEDKTYESERVAFGELAFLSYLQVDFAGLIQKYPVREEVLVFYDPTNPKRAVLEPVVRQEGVIALGVGVFFLVLGSGSFLSLGRRPPSNETIDY